VKTSGKTGSRQPTVNTQSNLNDAARAAKAHGENKPLDETIARFKAHRKSIGEKLFHDYDLPLVATVAAQIRREGIGPEEAAKEAFKLLDACRDESSERAEKPDTITNAEVPMHALEFGFLDGVCTITGQQQRPGRAEEYFRKFLVSERGSDLAVIELGRLKRAGFTRDEVAEYQERYAKFRRPRRKKL
jgi:hypothetical protein